MTSGSASEPAGTFDAEKYRASVLEPARRSGVPPGDLYARYAVTAQLAGNEEAFAEHLKKVVNYWGTLKQKRSYATLATALLAAHAELDRAGSLKRAVFERVRNAELNQARKKIDDRVAVLAQRSTCITARTFANLMETAGGRLDEADIRSVVVKKGLRIIEAWDIPTAPPSPKCVEIKRNLAVLGLRLSAEVVFGEAVRTGFRLRDGFTVASRRSALSTADIEDARVRVDRQAHDERSTAAKNVLVIMSAQAAEPDGLNTLLKWEIADRLRPLLEDGYPPRVLADEAADLGLDRREAEEFAVSVLETGIGARHSDPVGDVEELLRQGELRAAQRLLVLLPADEATNLRKTVAAEAARVASLAVQAEQERAAGNTERAAELLTEAVEQAVDDDDLAERLRRIPPPPVTGVRAVGDGARAIVTWAPSAARVGSLTYRIVRTLGSHATTANQGTTIAETAAAEVVDPSPSVAQPLFYTIFASRAEGIWSAGTASQPIRLVPDVTDVDVTADVRSVSGSWRVHPHAVRIEIERQEFPAGRSRTTASTGWQGADHIRPSGMLGFTDTAVRSGVTYQYRVRAVYLDGAGVGHVAAGVVATVQPAPPPIAVDDLRIEVVTDRGQPALRATWTPRDSYDVSIRISKEAPRWEPKATLPAAELAQYGKVVAGQSARVSGGKTVLTFPLVHGPHFVTAVTTSGTRATLGNTVPFVFVEPVRQLQAERFGDVARLSWVWPEGSHLARVTWITTSSVGKSGGDLACHRRTYENNGGLEISVGSEQVAVTVRAVVNSADGEAISPPATVEVPGLRPQVSYQLRQRRSKATLVLTCERSCHVPELVVVHSTGPVMPLTPAHGDVIGRVPAQRLEAATPLSMDFALPRARGKRWLACFPHSPQANVTLVGSAVGG